MSLKKSPPSNLEQENRGSWPDAQYANWTGTPPELAHHYGSQVHILQDTQLLTLLALLCSKDTQQPVVNELITRVYTSLLACVLNREFPIKRADLPTRMSADHAEGIYQGPIIDRTTPTVSVNLARAGTLPSHVCYSYLNYVLDPSAVRQDHIHIARTTDDGSKVTGSSLAGVKIAGPIDGATVLIPDPMGATGSTLIRILDLYKEMGKAKKFIAMHCIVTPEYLRRVLDAHPDLIVYAARLDRGLSEKDVLKTPLGKLWSKEKGLNAKSYIVPGGGGFGEILNNALS